ncbi:MAG: ribosomal protein S18-alanine N-acetyltransferase [Thermodesulfobacteriota bacterium]
MREEAQIRIMAASDLAEVTAMDQLFPSPWSQALFRQQLTAKFAFHFVVCQPGHGLIAFICGQAVANEAEIHKLAVTPAWQQQGVASRLLKHTMAEVAASAFFLEVRGANQAALALYAKMGFTAVGCRKGYYSSPADDAVTMRLQR